MKLGRKSAQFSPDPEIVSVRQGLWILFGAEWSPPVREFGDGNQRVSLFAEVAYSQNVGKRPARIAGGELDVLRAIRRRAAKGTRGRDLRLGIGDDCALLRPREGEELAVTTDLSIAGRHFQLEWHPPETVGWRTLARGLSDLAAMGARPVAAFLSLGVPRELAVGAKNRKSWVDRFLDGFFSLAEAHKTPLAGGDLAEAPVALADVVLIGAVPRGTALLRSGARPGDMLYVTGSLGGAAAGLKLLAELAVAGSEPIPDPRNDSLSAQLRPKPRIQTGLSLRRRGLATAAIDISDGLSTDLAHLCEESGVSAMIHAGRLPIVADASLEQALHGGEDYELLFTARPGTRIPRSIAGVAVTQIGEITAPDRDKPGGKPNIMLATGCIVEPLEPRGWEHFSAE
jgi:thiamine-monophosphate kinase